MENETRDADEKQLLQRLLDENNCEPIILFYSGKRVEFEQVAIVVFNNGEDLFVVMRPRSPMEGLNDDEVIVFKYYEENDSLRVEEDEEVSAAVFEVFLAMVSAGEEGKDVEIPQYEFEEIEDDDGNLIAYAIAGFAENDKDEDKCGYYIIPAIYHGKPVTEIREFAFEGASDIDGMIILSKVAKIGEGAFSECENLEEITIGKDVKFIGSNAFSDCYNLTAVRISDVAAWCSIEFENEAANPLYNDNNQGIAWGAKAEDLVRTIQSVFHRLEGDTNLYRRLYLNGDEVSDLHIPTGVTKIRDFAFAGAKYLHSLVLPRSIKEIGRDAFRCCGELTNIYYDGTLREWNGIKKESTWNQVILSYAVSTVHCGDGIISKDGKVTSR